MIKLSDLWVWCFERTNHGENLTDVSDLSMVAAEEDCSLYFVDLGSKEKKQFDQEHQFLVDIQDHFKRNPAQQVNDPTFLFLPLKVA